MSIALVTGASQGLGKALCQELIARGWTVIGIARSTDKLEDLKLQYKDHFYPIVCDVSDKDAVLKASRSLQEGGLCPTLFFLNAAATGETAIEPLLDLEKHQMMMQTNYFGVLSWIAAWEKPCQANGGATFVVTCSVNAIFAPPSVIAYSASKAAIAKAFEALSTTYADTTLHFCVVYAGPIDTAGLKTPRKLPFTMKPAALAKYMVQSALKKKEHCEPSLFYSTVTRILHYLPSKWVAKVLKS